MHVLGSELQWRLLRDIEIFVILFIVSVRKVGLGCEIGNLR